MADNSYLKGRWFVDDELREVALYVSRFSRDDDFVVVAGWTVDDGGFKRVSDLNRLPYQIVRRCGFKPLSDGGDLAWWVMSQSSGYPWHKIVPKFALDGGRPEDNPQPDSSVTRKSDVVKTESNADAHTLQPGSIAHADELPENDRPPIKPDPSFDGDLSDEE